MWRWAFVWLLAAIVPVWAQPVSAQPARLALVIGNSTYAGLPPVPACEASSGVVAAALRRAGFTVTALMNPSNGQMGAAIGTFRRQFGASTRQRRRHLWMRLRGRLPGPRFPDARLGAA